MSQTYYNYKYNGINKFTSPLFNEETSEIKTYVNTIEVTFTFFDVNKTEVVLDIEPNVGDIVEVLRTTKSDSRLVDYVNGSILREEILDLDSNQLFYLAQEAIGNTERSLFLFDLLDTDNFNGNLSINDKTIQEAFDTIDNMTLGESSLYSVDTTNFNNNLSVSDDTVQKAFNTLDNLTSLNLLLDTTYFDNNLSSSEDTVQKAFTKIDDLDILNHSNNIKLQGAIENVNSTSQFIDASLLGKVYIPEGDWLLEPIGSEIEKVLATLNNIECNGTLNINLPAGLNILTSQIIINSSSANKIFINGVSTNNTTIVSYDSFTGSVKNYSLTYTVNNTSNIDIGDYVIIRQDITGTGNYPLHSGVWEVTNVTSSQITILNKSHSDQIDNSTVTGGNVSILKTVLRFDGCDGFRFEGSQPLGTLDNLCIKGDYSVSDSTGTTGCHGVITSSPVVTPGSDSNDLFEPNGIVKLGQFIGITNFGEQGIACSGRTSMVANFVASCGNRKRGFYSEGANIRAKFSIANGNGEDGFISDVQGAITCSYSTASGNGLNGFWSTNNSFMGSAYSKAFCNQSDGIEVRGLGRATIDGGICSGNIGNGVNVSDGGMIDADSCLSENNGLAGFNSVVSSTIDCNNSSSNNNGTYGYKSSYNSSINSNGGSNSDNNSGSYYNSYNSILLDNSGLSIAEVKNAGYIDVKFFNPATDKYWKNIITSVGDNVLNSSNGNWFTMKIGDGTFRPYNDNNQNLGDASYRWKEIFAGNATINTSDERTKTELLSIDDKETLVAKELKSNLKKFKFLDSVEEKGFDNARIHFGVGAQTVKSIFEKYELNPDSYALLCYNEWEEELNDNGEVIKEAGNRYGIRYEELLAFIIAAM